MCIKAVEKEAETLEHVPDHFKAREMCIKALEREAGSLEHVLDHFKTEEMSKRAIEANLCTLVFCPDWFVIQEQIKSWCNDDCDNEAPGWHDCYQKRKAQEAQIKEELVPIAWHPSIWLDLDLWNIGKLRSLIILKHRRHVLKQLKNIHGIGVCFWSSEDP